LGSVHHKLQHGGPAVFNGSLHRRPDVIGAIYPQSVGPHGPGHWNKALGIGDIHTYEAVVVKVNLIFLFGAPGHVAKYTGHHWKIMLDGCADLMQTHPPGAVADYRKNRSLRAAQLSAQGRGIGKAGVAKGQGGNMSALSCKFKITVGDGGNISYIGGYNGVFGKRPGNLQKSPAGIDGVAFNHGGTYCFIFPLFLKSSYFDHAVLVDLGLCFERQAP